MLGSNDHVLQDQKFFISNGSYATNAFAPLLRILDDDFGVMAGHMTTIHCYTGSQPTVDAPRGPALERKRAAVLSIVPTTTSAASLIYIILPKLAGWLKGCAVWVPTAIVSAVDLTRQLASKTDVSALIIYLKTARSGILRMTDKPPASSNLRVALKVW